ncbi:GNAT family N-acetyltransferase [Parvularcula sp. IMCC14364]|uniref:GNAT family N-acetyltransferase n=1 Tax=Parvularcula sp. IMCC14364 TaxID=3067902 RepID=UPI0027409BC2|nr:GNAT family N-acetyltransferase [Parvularcula sp. IMCC14364]
MQCETNLLENGETVDHLVADWTKLAASTSHTVFQAPGWIKAWLPLAITRAKLTAFRVFDDDLVACAIVGQNKVRKLPGIHIHEVRLSESADDLLDSIYVEYNRPLCKPRYQSICDRLIFKQLFDSFPNVGSFVFRNIDNNTRESLLECTYDVGWPCYLVEEGFSWATDLSTDGEVESPQTAQFSKNTRAQLQRSIRLYTETEPLTVTEAKDTAQRQEIWKKLAELHQASWQKRGKTGVFGNSDFVEFHERLITDSPELVSLLEIRAGAKTIGCLYNHIHDGTSSSYQSGFLYEDDNRFKPGLVSHYLAMRHYADLGYTAYDMMYGEARYKRSLGKQYQKLSTIEVTPPGLRRNAINFLKTLKGGTFPRIQYGS